MLSLTGLHWYYAARIERIRKNGRASAVARASASRMATFSEQGATIAFFILFLIYPGTSSAILSFFQCFEVDGGKRYLRLDFSIDCDSGEHTRMTLYAVIMVFIYPLGVGARGFELTEGSTREYLRGACVGSHPVDVTHSMHLAEAQTLIPQVPFLYYLLFKWHEVALGKLEAAEQLQARLEKAAEAERTHSKREKGRQRDGALAHIGLDFELQEAPKLAKKHEPKKHLRTPEEVALEQRLSALAQEQEDQRDALPAYVRKLIHGYEMRVYGFEIFESCRKLALVGVPVFFTPAGSVSQLTFALLVCFLTFGLYTSLSPYSNPDEDRLAQMGQVQIFFVLLSSLWLRYDHTDEASDSLDVILTVFTFLPMVFALMLEAGIWKVRYSPVRNAVEAADSLRESVELSIRRRAVAAGWAVERGAQRPEEYRAPTRKDTAAPRRRLPRGRHVGNGLPTPARVPTMAELIAQQREAAYDGECAYFEDSVGAQWEDAGVGFDRRADQSDGEDEMISHEHKMRRSSVEPSAAIRVPQDATAGAEPSSPVHRRMIRKRDSDLAKSTGCLANHPGRETSRRRGHDSPDIRHLAPDLGPGGTSVTNGHYASRG